MESSSSNNNNVPEKYCTFCGISEKQNFNKTYEKRVVETYKKRKKNAQNDDRVAVDTHIIYRCKLCRNSNLKPGTCYLCYKFIEYLCKLESCNNKVYICRSCNPQQNDTCYGKSKNCYRKIKVVCKTHKRTYPYSKKFCGACLKEQLQN